VAEVSVTDGKVRVHRMVCAIDCGQYVNPGIIAAQTEGGAIFGASAALFQELTFENGRLQQTNFNTFPVMRMNECPEIETHIVENDEKAGRNRRAGSSVRGAGHRQRGVCGDRKTNPPVADPNDGGRMKRLRVTLIYSGS
jgi:xanthine dehydrogenase molybdopterin-binding subunit B